MWSYHLKWPRLDWSGVFEINVDVISTRNSYMLTSFGVCSFDLGTFFQIPLTNDGLIFLQSWTSTSYLFLKLGQFICNLGSVLPVKLCASIRRLAMVQCEDPEVAQLPSCSNRLLTYVGEWRRLGGGFTRSCATAFCPTRQSFNDSLNRSVSNITSTRVV